MRNRKPAVLFFDVNETLLDLKEVRQSVARALNGVDEVVSLWFETLLHYSLVATETDEFHDFGEIAAASLVMLANTRNIDLNMEKARNVLKPILSAQPYPEVSNALKLFRDVGFKLVAITNSSRKSMEAQLENAGIANFFDKKLSVEDIGLYKPHRHVYRWGARQMATAPENCLFIAAHGWDVAGAISAGMQTAFISRPGQQLYPLASSPTYLVSDLKLLAESLLSYSS
ncbi:MAG TPA: haloacid dehalogenase type II [Balneolaceae bacterium]|nr:haloacid dehalogenase type II [Balneolales bacterium]HKK46774.1 haloacid dehalogenase type II [Balneolaceae bacterium]